MENIAKVFAVNLKNRRRMLKLTQKELADKIGYSEKSISKWESGTSVAPSIILPDLAQALEINMDELFGYASGPVYYLGIDGGGTKTEFVLTDREGNVLNRYLLGSGNPVDIGIERTLDVLNTGIMNVCANIPFRKISAFVGLAGGTTGDYKQQIHEFLQKYNFCCVNNGSDVQNAVAGALGDKDGIVVIMGTGDIAFSQIDRTLYRTGGFGYLFDEGGSGYSIGRDAILASLKAEEGTGKKTIISEMISQKFESNCVFDILSKLYIGGKRKIASFAPAVFEAYEKGDKVAKEIIEKNMKQITVLIDDATRHFENQEKIEVVLVGGVSKKSDIILPIIKKYIKNKNKYNFSVYNAPTVNGALALAREYKEANGKY